jgi:membrane-bound serine protease (ClpP class)
MAGVIILLLVIGFVFILLETLMPGAVIGVLGVSALIVGVYLSFHEYGTTTGMMIFIGTLVGVVATAVAGLKMLPHTPIGRRMLLRQNVDFGAGDNAAEQERRKLIGREGHALTDLRPSGKAQVADKRWDVVTEGGYIDAGRRVRVIDVVGMRIVVAPLADDTGPEEKA